MSLCRSADININCDSRHSLKKKQHNSIYHWLSVMFKPLFFYKCSFLQGGGRPWIQKAQRWKPPNPVFHLSISVPNLQLSAAQYLNDVWGWAKATPRTRDNLHRGKIWENKHAATKHYQIPMEFIGCSLKVNIRLLGGVASVYAGCQQAFPLRRPSDISALVCLNSHQQSAVRQRSPRITPTTILFLSLINATCFSLNQN